MTHNMCHHLLVFPNPRQRTIGHSTTPPPSRKLALPDVLKEYNTADATMNQPENHLQPVVVIFGTLSDEQQVPK